LDLFELEARNLGKSARTKARLMDAAASVFARDGFEAASINEIARTAKLANGTFYVYFKDKEEIAQAVTFRIASDITQKLDEAMAGVTDAMERTSYATRRFIDIASSEPQWGRTMVRAFAIFQDLRQSVCQYLRADLELGKRQGSFTVEIDDFLIRTFAGTVIAGLFSRLNNEAGSDTGSKLAELQLRMLGVDPAVAKEVAWREIETLRLDMKPLPKILAVKA
jgi:AcrR family transcriptional regulator